MYFLYFINSLHKRKEDKTQFSPNYNETPKESSQVYNTYNETYDSIYDLPIPQNMDRPPSYREEYDHVNGKIDKTYDCDSYVEPIELSADI
jgi:hypothetical protein